MKKKTKLKVQGTSWKEQMPLPNIHLNKGKWPQSGKELYTFSSISIYAILVKFMKTSQNNNNNMLQGYKQLVPCAY